VPLRVDDRVQMLVIIAHDEGDFGGGGVRRAVIATHGDEVISVFYYESEAVHVIDLREAPHLIGGELRMLVEIPR